ncbi:MAG: bifunctional glutamate N-acetyltransferase/amino-acid acetyltransferase ArgJ [Phycisphaerae bacterium]|nr:bifunctional glutamate N-acetyltransferase/amino-acid acetyltransferase ArgJ [Phycisphaerae bacterium]
MVNKTLTAPLGFQVGAVKAGIKRSGKFDLGLIVADVPCTAAAVFTKNKIASPTIAISRKHVRNGQVQAVFVNAGNANACTGQQGHDDGMAICRQVAERLGIKPSDVLVTSTGIIGKMLPMDKVEAGIDQAINGLAHSAARGKELARAIMTTDLTPKLAYREIMLGKRVVKIAGIAKGSGMIAPNMATMLGYITTDVAISAPLLRQAMREACDITFNKVSVDNHNSTNDSAIVLASGLAKNRMLESDSRNYQLFAEGLRQVCDDLARQIAADGEGARCAVTVRLTGAATKAQAHKAIRAIVDSPLVRTAFNGADPNWGRIVSAVGYSGARFDPAKLLCKIAGTTVYENGGPCAFDAAVLSRKMKKKYWEIDVDLAIGTCDDFCYTCDLSHGYITINAEYHT